MSDYLLLDKPFAGLTMDNFLENCGKILCNEITP